VASPSLGQDASLSFVVIGRGQQAEGRLRISDCGLWIVDLKKQKTEILLWERLSAAISRFERFERFERFQRFQRFTAYCLPFTIYDLTI